MDIAITGGPLDNVCMIRAGAFIVALIIAAVATGCSPPANHEHIRLTVAPAFPGRYAALDQRIDLDLKATTLVEAITAIEQRTGFEVQAEAVERFVESYDNGLWFDLRLKDVPARAALETALALYHVRNGDSMPAYDLHEQPTSVAIVSHDSEGFGGYRHYSCGGMLDRWARQWATCQPPKAGSVFVQPTHGERVDQIGDELVAHLRATVNAEAWDAGGAEAWWVDNVLTIRAPRRVQARIEAELRLIDRALAEGTGLWTEAPVSAARRQALDRLDRPWTSVKDGQSVNALIDAINHEAGLNTIVLRDELAIDFDRPLVWPASVRSLAGALNHLMDVDRGDATDDFYAWVDPHGTVWIGPQHLVRPAAFDVVVYDLAALHEATDFEQFSSELRPILGEVLRSVDNDPYPQPRQRHALVYAYYTRIGPIMILKTTDRHHAVVQRLLTDLRDALRSSE